LPIDVEGTGAGINSGADLPGIADRVRTEGGGGWGMGPLGRGVCRDFRVLDAWAYG